MRQSGQSSFCDERRITTKSRCQAGLEPRSVEVEERMYDIVGMCTLLSSTLLAGRPIVGLSRFVGPGRQKPENLCCSGRGGGDRIYQAAESKGTLRNVLYS